MKRRKGTGATIEPVTLMFPPLDDSETMQVASQASVNAEENLGQGSLNSLLKEMFAEFKTSQKEMAQTIIDQSKNHAALMEQQRKNMENRLEMQRQEMELRMEMRMKEMTVHTERSVSSVISQVP
jgi:hypothetical protein